MERQSEFRYEPLEEWFFQASVLVDGYVVGAPPEAVRKYAELKASWLMTHPRNGKEEPELSLSPVRESDREGYIVRTGILYTA